MRTRDMAASMLPFENDSRSKFLHGSIVIARFDMVGCRNVLCRDRDLCGGAFSTTLARFFNSIAAQMMYDSGFTILGSLVVNDEINCMIAPWENNFNRDREAWTGRLSSRIGVIAASMLHMASLDQWATDADLPLPFDADRVCFNSRLLTVPYMETISDYFSFRLQQGRDAVVRTMFAHDWAKDGYQSTPNNLSLSDMEIRLRRSPHMSVASLQFLDNLGAFHFWTDAADADGVDTQRRCVTRTPIGSSREARAAADAVVELFTTEVGSALMSRKVLPYVRRNASDVQVGNVADVINSRIMSARNAADAWVTSATDQLVKDEVARAARIERARSRNAESKIGETPTTEAPCQD